MHALRRHASEGVADHIARASRASHPLTGTPCWNKAQPRRKEVLMEQLKFDFPIPEGYIVKFVAYRTVNGKRLYAKAYGKRAWPILVKAKP